MKKAAIAVAHRVLIIAWHLIAEGGVYREAGGNYYDRLRPERTARRLARRLEQIGFQVTLKPNQAAGAVAATTPAPSYTVEPAPAVKASVADPKICPRCAKWKIPCIHARNAILTATHIQLV